MQANPVYYSKSKKGQPVAAKTITQINRPPSQLFRMQISLTASPNKELTLIFLLLSPQHFYSCATRSAPQRESQILRITNQPACIQFKTMDQKNSNKERNNQLFCVMPPTTMIWWSRGTSVFTTGAKDTFLQEVAQLRGVQPRVAPVVVHMGRRHKVAGPHLTPGSPLPLDEWLHWFRWDHPVGRAVYIQLGALWLLQRQKLHDIR